MKSDTTFFNIKNIGLMGASLLLVVAFFIYYSSLETLKNATPVFAKIIQVQGNAFRASSQGDNETPIISGDSLKMGESVITDSGSSLTLEFSDQSKLLISENSQVTLKRMMQSQDTGEVETTLQLDDGRIESRVTKHKTFKPRFRVVTPALQFSVRGTTFAVAVNKKTGETSSRVIEGMVIAAASGKEVELTKGFGLVTKVGEQPGVASPLSGAPELIQMANEIHYFPLNLSWKPIKNIAEYRLQLMTGPSYEYLIHDQVYRGHQAQLLNLPDAQYKMRVRGINSTGLEGMDGEQNFILNAHPIPPKIIAPLNSQVIKKKKSKFYWKVSNEAKTYLFQVSDKEDFSNLLTQVGNLMGTLKGISVKLPDGQYFWRIASVSSNNESGPFSQSQKFIVDRSKK